MSMLEIFDTAGVKVEVGDHIHMWDSLLTKGDDNLFRGIVTDINSRFVIIHWFHLVGPSKYYNVDTTLFGIGYVFYKVS